MDSQRTVDHLRDEANARKDTTLGDLLDTAAEELDEAEDTIDAKAHSIAVLQEEAEQLKNTIDRLKHEHDHFKNGFERTVEKNLDEYEFTMSAKPRFVWQSLNGKPHYWDRDTDHIPKSLEFCNESVWLVPGTGDDE